MTCCKPDPTALDLQTMLLQNAKKAHDAQTYVHFVRLDHSEMQWCMVLKCTTVLYDWVIAKRNGLWCWNICPSFVRLERSFLRHDMTCSRKTIMFTPGIRVGPPSLLQNNNQVYRGVCNIHACRACNKLLQLFLFFLHTSRDQCESLYKSTHVLEIVDCSHNRLCSYAL